MNHNPVLHALDFVQRKLLLSTDPPKIRLAKAPSENVDEVFGKLPRLEAYASFSFDLIHRVPDDAQLITGFN